MIPDYLAVMFALAAFAYAMSTLTETILMIKEFRKTNESKKSEGLGVLFQ